MLEALLEGVEAEVNHTEALEYSVVSHQLYISDEETSEDEDDLEPDAQDSFDHIPELCIDTQQEETSDIEESEPLELSEERG